MISRSSNLFFFATVEHHYSIMEYLLGEYKLVVLGARGAGKSTLAYRFMCGYFMEEYDSFLYDKYGFRKQITLINDEKPLIDIMDALEGEKYTDLQLKTHFTSICRSTNREGFILVYSVTSLDTFTAISQFIEDIHQARDSQDVPIVIIGTKTDLPARDVSYAHGEEIAKKYNALFYEVNVTTGANVEEAVIQLCLKIRDKKLNEHSSTGREMKTKEKDRCNIC